MDCQEVILTRCSIRSYLSEQPATPQQINEILMMAMHAPSAMNKRPWAFMVVTNKNLLKRIEQAHPYAGFAVQAGTAIIVCGNTRESYEDYWCVDPLLAGQNILLSAQAIGLSTCWCGVYPDGKKMKDIADILRIPSPYQPMALIIVGTSNISSKTSANRYEKKKIHFNKW